MKTESSGSHIFKTTIEIQLGRDASEKLRAVMTQDVNWTYITLLQMKIESSGSHISKTTIEIQLERDASEELRAVMTFPSRHRT